ncbi:uncharacterized protein LOC115620578 [Scaptodrosophila lebanonensis]|uniref:Uncharacterized protein LOC115620578 n=1 Tax=Drosophila lebanonensis TaxID=7225 RepID=A0A6J2T370_DROLE|nr:uncharacterized protein LOC115620578 [Scaptodrosophila lebanonensis]
MSKHNYTNPAFCQNSEFYPVPSAAGQQQSQQHVESIYNRSLQLNFNGQTAAANRNPREGPLRMQRSMSTRSFNAPQAARKRPQHQQQQQPQKQHQQQAQTSSGRYALVPLEDLASQGTLSNRYAIVPGGAALAAAKRYAKSQDNLDRYASQQNLPYDEEPHSFHEEEVDELQFTSLPPQLNVQKAAPKIKHAFSSDFGSKTFLIVDKNSNQRYQMVPTAENEELVDENQEIIQMHNGRAHRYAVIPTEGDDDDDADDDFEPQQETCLSHTELNQSQHFSQLRTSMRTSTPQQGNSLLQLPTQSQTPLKNAAAATRALHELLATPRKMQPPPRAALSTPRNAAHHEQLQRERRLQFYQSQQHINYVASVAPAMMPALPQRQAKLSPQRLHYETVRPAPPPPTTAPAMVTTTALAAQQTDRTMAVISPRVAGAKLQPHQELEQDCSFQGKSYSNKSYNHNNNNNSYPQKLANATVTLAVVSLMLVLGSTMNAGLIIYMIAHFGKSFFLQFGLVASFCGMGLGFLGFRSRQCDWLPNRSYTSGYILVTIFCLLKCCGLLVILVLDPFPGLPLHDVTTGVILGLSTFTMFFIGLGVIGSLWCYRPPPDNRVNVV